MFSIQRYVQAVYLASLFVIMSLTGCATQKPMYYWGDYEQVIYDMYVNPGEADPATQIEKLTATIQKAQSEGMPVPPGLYAHLAMMYAKEGNSKLAAEALNEEKNNFPESATFIDGLMARAKLEPKK